MTPRPKLEIQSYFAAIIHTWNFAVAHQELDLVSDWEIEFVGSSGLQFIHRSGRVQQTTQLYVFPLLSSKYPFKRLAPLARGTKSHITSAPPGCEKLHKITDIQYTILKPCRTLNFKIMKYINKALILLKLRPHWSCKEFNSTRYSLKLLHSINKTKLQTRLFKTQRAIQLFLRNFCAQLCGKAMEKWLNKTTRSPPKTIFQCLSYSSHFYWSTIQIACAWKCKRLYSNLFIINFYELKRKLVTIMSIF